jgi:heat shock protein HslJ
MSGRPFPHTVVVAVNGETYTGCGGDTESLLVGEEWRVIRLEGREPTGLRRPTLLFAAGGVLTGDGGCNRFHATYEITGEGFAIGPVAATRMACAEPEANAQEGRFFSLLEQVTRFDIAEDGSLELFAMEHAVIVAQR